MSELLEVSLLAGLVLSAIAAIWLLAIGWSWAGEKLSDRRIAMLAKRIQEHREREEWVAGSEALTEVVRLLRRRPPTRDIRASLAYALDDQAEFALEMDRDDDELRLQREAYTFAAGVEGLPPDEVAWFAMRLCFALCRRQEFTEAIVFAEKAMEGADPDGDVAAMARRRPAWHIAAQTRWRGRWSWRTKRSGSPSPSRRSLNGGRG